MGFMRFGGGVEEVFWGGGCGLGEKPKNEITFLIVFLKVIGKVYSN